MNFAEWVKGEGRCTASEALPLGSQRRNREQPISPSHAKWEPLQAPDRLWRPIRRSVSLCINRVYRWLVKSPEGPQGVSPFCSCLSAVGVLVSYGVALLLLARAIEVLPLGVTIAVWAGVGVAATAVLGMLFFGERLSASRIVSLALIALGIVLVGVFPGSSP